MKYLNLHILFSFAAANPNRDDSGSPKRIEYGGAIRSRISSQAMTRPKRVMFEADTPGELTARSALMADEIANKALKLLSEAGTTVDGAQETKLRRAAVKATTGLIAKPEKAEKKAALSAKEEGANEDEASKDTLVWLAEDEINKAAARLAAQNDEELRADDLVSPGHTRSLSIAAFGRMFAARPDLQTEAAIQRSHAFTTHATENEVDYFTTVDDLRTSAGHLGLAELTSGVYYWHANVNASDLLETWQRSGDQDSADRLRNLFLSLFTALPSGKQNTTAHHVLPSLVVAVPSDRPVSLQTAFERPVNPDVRHQGYLTPSIDRLLAEHAQVSALLPSSFGQARAAGMGSADESGAVTRVPNLEVLAEQCAQMVLEAGNQSRGGQK